MPGPPDPYLIGNGEWCSTCFPDGRPDTSDLVGSTHWNRPIRRGCNECAGKGRIAFTAEEIVRRTVAERRTFIATAETGGSRS